MWFGVRLLAKAKIGVHFSKSFLVDIFWLKIHVELIVYQIVKDPNAYFDSNFMKIVGWDPVVAVTFWQTLLLYFIL